MKEKALKLADELLRENTQVSVESAYMIRKLVEELDRTKPLNNEEIDKIIYSVDWAYDPVLLARAIEERHGIK